jgi:3-oxoacyl-[acyl-carrier protein] reductase
MDTGLAGRTVLVPGSTSGLGLACARGFTAEGASVVMAGRRGERGAAEAENLSATMAGSAVGLEVDLAEEGAAERLVAQATEAFGPVDVLVLNSGGPPAGTATDATPEDIEAAAHTLLLQQVRLVRAVLPGMRERGWGRIVAIGSSGVQQPIEGLALSNVVRAGLAGYLKTLAGEVAGSGVTVNMVLPGRIDTDRVASLDQGRAEKTGSTPDEVRRATEGTIPVGRYGDPDEFAAAVVFLASVPAAYITGEQLRVDGGMVRSY